MTSKTAERMSERVLFGLLIIVGYFLIGGLGGLANLNDDQRSTIRDILLTVGPILGMIAQSIWKTDRNDDKRMETLNVLANRVPHAGMISGGSYYEKPLTGADAAGDSVVDSNGVELADGGAPVAPSWRRPTTP